MMEAFVVVAEAAEVVEAEAAEVVAAAVVVEALVDREAPVEDQVVMVDDKETGGINTDCFYQNNDL